MEKEYQVQGGYLQYSIQGHCAEITGASALLGEAGVPDMLEGMPVKSVDKKAFLSKKYLGKASLPATLETVGDWAFAYCGRLREVALGSDRVTFGKMVFMECPALSRIVVPGKSETVAVLLAAAVNGMDAGYLLEPAEAGEPQWFEKWDARLAALLDTPDEEGYSRQVLCGEEDYESVNYEAYTENKRKNKAALAYLRLLYPDRLQEDLKGRLEEYLRSHTKGCRTQEAWLVLLQRFARQSRYYILFAHIGGLTRQNQAEILEDIGEDAPEMKGYFMSYFEKQEQESFFSELLL